MCSSTAVSRSKRRSYGSAWIDPDGQRAQSPGTPRRRLRDRRGEPYELKRRLHVRRYRIDELPAELHDRLVRGQPEARAELFRRYAPQVRRILFLQGYCEEVDDAVQEVFIKVFRADIPGHGAFLGWFYRLILNTGRDQGRRRRTRQVLADRLEQVAPESTTADAPPPPDETVKRALLDLPTELREAVALRFYVDLPLEQIAEAQQVPLGTVKSRLHTAMTRLRGALTDAGYVRDTSA